jgi:hypothetical protein
MIRGPVGALLIRIGAVTVRSMVSQWHDVDVHEDLLS